MKFSTTLIAFAAAGLASAQLPDVPACSLSCFLSALQGDGCSELLDFKCHCQKTELVSSITPCVAKACDHSDQVSVSNAVVNQCSSAGHPISIPPIETSASASASETSTPSSAPAETTASATPTASASESSSAVESSSSAAETESSTTGAAGTTTAGSAPVGSSSGAATSTPLVTTTGSASPSSSSPAFNGAGNVKGNLAGVAALAAAAAYVL